VQRRVQEFETWILLRREFGSWTSSGKLHEIVLFEFCFFCCYLWILRNSRTTSMACHRAT
jgi:hypothetical protein